MCPRLCLRTTLAALVAFGLLPLALGRADAAEDHRHEIVIQNKAFAPKEETITVGEALTWVHEDPGAFHTVTADDGSFDSNPGCTAEKTNRCMREGGVFRHTFREVGRFPYHSKLHGGARGNGASGVVVVVAEGEPEDDSHGH